MTVKDAGTAAPTSPDQRTTQPEQAVEAAHLIGSGVLTGGIAIVLTVIAIPVALGLGLARGAKSIAQRVRGGRATGADEA